MTEGEGFVLAGVHRDSPTSKEQKKGKRNAPEKPFECHHHKGTHEGNTHIIIAGPGERFGNARRSGGGGSDSKSDGGKASHDAKTCTQEGRRAFYRARRAAPVMTSPAPAYHRCYGVAYHEHREHRNRDAQRKGHGEE
jgi:hypothetical protein